jgi:hypothetical protein
MTRDTPPRVLQDAIITVIVDDKVKLGYRLGSS